MNDDGDKFFKGVIAVDDSEHDNGKGVNDDDEDKDNYDDDNDDLYIIGAVCMYVCMYVSKSHYLCIQRIFVSQFFF